MCWITKIVWILTQQGTDQHALAADAAAAPEHEAVLRLLDELRLDVVQVLGAVVPHQGKVGLEQLLFEEDQLSVKLLRST